MTKIIVDDQEYEIKEGQNMLQAVLSLGLDLPYFCWHPALGSVGACRQCAVKQFKDDEDIHGNLVMACITPATENLRISIDDPEAWELRKSVIEWMMVNHPHDCPICDEGGECHLQDMTVMTGHTYRDYSFKKRTYRNQNLGPFINHEMNRCIQCYRCVRFYRDYAGGRDFNVFAAHDHVYFGRQEDGALENEFSGNLIEVCPTGVFTDKTFKGHYARKWDLQTAPSICIGCGLGCNITPGERYGKLRRIRNRYNGEVNGYFICDRGRFGYEFVNSERRIRNPLLRLDGGNEAEQVSEHQALEHVAGLLRGANRVIGIGSPRSSLEANYALRRLVGPESFYIGFSENDDRLVRMSLEILQHGPVHSPSLREIDESDVVLVLGEDLTNTAPMMALYMRQLVHRKAAQVAEKFEIPKWNDIAIREIIQHEKEMLFIAAPTATKLDDIAKNTYQATPDDIARLGFAVAHTLDPNSPEVVDLSEQVQALVDEIARALSGASHPLIVSGTSCGSLAVMQAAANIAWALCRDERCTDLAYTVPEPNSLGVGLLGGGTLQDAFQVVADGTADMVIILENDLYQRADPDAVDAFLDAAKHVIVLDYLENATNLQAEVVLPAATFVETDGTWINNEGRAQRAYQVFVPEGEIRGSWRWLHDLMSKTGQLPTNAWNVIDDVLNEIAEELPTFGPITHIAPSADYRIIGQKIPRQSQRYSGRTSMHADKNIHEPQPPADPDSPLAFSMEGFNGQPPSPLITRFWAPGWNSIQSLNKFQSEIAGPLRGGDPGCRLIDQVESQSINYFKTIPPAYVRRQHHWMLVPLYHIFGSEPLSMLTSAVAQRAPKPYLALNDLDADGLQLEDGDQVEMTLNGQVYCLPVKRLPSLTQGAVGLPVGLSRRPINLAGNLGIQRPIWVQISRSKNHE
jgi:NADH-quinone oxidoreductase subunit G